MFALWNRSSQPAFEGVPLSEWVALYTKPKAYPRFGRPDNAAEAIRHIGTNALPLLLALVDNPPRGLWRKGGDLSQRLPDWMRYNVAARWLRQHHRAILIPEDARSISFVLGPIAAPAIPELLQRLASTNWTGRRDLASYALACTGRDALVQSAPSYIPLLLNDSDVWVRMAATNALLEANPGSHITALPP